MLTQQRPHPYRRVAVATRVALLCGACVPLFGREATAQAQIELMRWKIEATVTDLHDPLGLFPDIRPGDPVRAMLKYDRGIFPHPFYSGLHDNYYSNDPWMETVRMVVENPRDGTEFHFQTDLDSEEYAFFDVYNDAVDDEEVFDIFYAATPVVVPDTYEGTSPQVAVWLSGPPDNLTSKQLPTEFTVDGWPIAGLLFFDGSFEDETGTFVEAELYSITRDLSPPLAGDYDFDGDVDVRDYYGWKLYYGETSYYQYADGNGDGRTDAADYVVWRNNLGANVEGGWPANVNVPEPGTLAFFIVTSILGIALHRSKSKAR
jgi:hypothetical protein